MQAIKKNPKTADYWIGKYKTNQTKNQYFVNCIGFGYDAAVAASAPRSRLKGIFNRLSLGPIIYLFYLFSEFHNVANFGNYEIHSIKRIAVFQTLTTVQLDGVEKKFSHCLLFLVNKSLILAEV